MDSFYYAQTMRLVLLYSAHMNSMRKKRVYDPTPNFYAPQGDFWWFGQILPQSTSIPDAICKRIDLSKRT